MACIDITRPAPSQELAQVITDHEERRLLRVELTLQCVSSGYLSGGCSCESTIPASAAIAAWARELERAGGDRFFHFAWSDGEWLAYGLENGLVRGVYCPAHSAERDERSFSYGSRTSAATRELALTA